MRDTSTLIDNGVDINYQDWLQAPEYPGKSKEDINNNIITTLVEVIPFLEKG